MAEGRHGMNAELPAQPDVMAARKRDRALVGEFFVGAHRKGHSATCQCGAQFTESELNGLAMVLSRINEGKVLRSEEDGAA